MHFFNGFSTISGVAITYRQMLRTWDTVLWLGKYSIQVESHQQESSCIHVDQSYSSDRMRQLLKITLRYLISIVVIMSISQPQWGSNVLLFATCQAVFDSNRLLYDQSPITAIFVVFLPGLQNANIQTSSESIRKFNGNQ